MKSTGIVRKVDELGRFVIPRELRTMLEIEVGTPLEVFIEGDSIILQKYSKGDIFTGEMEELIEYKGKLVSKKTILDLAKSAGLCVSGEGL